MPAHAQLSIGCTGGTGDGDGALDSNGALVTTLDGALDGGLTWATSTGCGPEAADLEDTGE